MADGATPPRPALRYHGGKWRLAPWIIQHFPPHRVYVEPFGGAASVLLRKPRSYAEVYNDLDDEVVNLFRVLRDGQAELLVQATRLTAFARCEFEFAYQPSTDPIERARRLLVRSFMGFGSDGHNMARTTGFRANAHRNGTHPAQDWAGMPAVLAAVAERFAGVVIEHRPALDVMAVHDRPDTLHYLDPPYMPETRSPKSRRGGLRYHAYTHEMTTEQHTELLLAAARLTGLVVLSGYPSALYAELLPDWETVERLAHADGARERREVLWLNPAASAALNGRLRLHAPELANA